MGKKSKRSSEEKHSDDSLESRVSSLEDSVKELKESVSSMSADLRLILSKLDDGSKSPGSDSSTESKSYSSQSSVRRSMFSPLEVDDDFKVEFDSEESTDRVQDSADREFAIEGVTVKYSVVPKGAKVVDPKDVFKHRLSTISLPPIYWKHWIHAFKAVSDSMRLAYLHVNVRLQALVDAVKSSRCVSVIEAVELAKKAILPDGVDLTEVRFNLFLRTVESNLGYSGLPDSFVVCKELTEFVPLPSESASSFFSVLVGYYRSLPDKAGLSLERFIDTVVTLFNRHLPCFSEASDLVVELSVLWRQSRTKDDSRLKSIDAFVRYIEVEILKLELKKRNADRLSSQSMLSSAEPTGVLPSVNAVSYGHSHNSENKCCRCCQQKCIFNSNKSKVDNFDKDKDKKNYDKHQKNKYHDKKKDRRNDSNGSGRRDNSDRQDRRDRSRSPSSDNRDSSRERKNDRHRRRSDRDKGGGSRRKGDDRSDSDSESRSRSSSPELDSVRKSHDRGRGDSISDRKSDDDVKSVNEVCAVLNPTEFPLVAKRISVPLKFLGPRASFVAKRILFDTGAEVSILNEKFARFLSGKLDVPLSQPASPVKISAFGGDVVRNVDNTIDLTCSYVDSDLPDNLLSCKFLVTDLPDMDGILGLDVINRFVKFSVLRNEAVSLETLHIDDIPSDYYDVEAASVAVFGSTPVVADAVPCNTIDLPVSVAESSMVIKPVVEEVQISSSPSVCATDSVSSLDRANPSILNPCDSPGSSLIASVAQVDRLAHTKRHTRLNDSFLKLSKHQREIPHIDYPTSSEIIAPCRSLTKYIWDSRNLPSLESGCDPPRAFPALSFMQSRCRSRYRMWSRVS